MERQKRPDEIARDEAQPPTEPIGTSRIEIGTVKWWNAAKGYGVIACADVAPWDIWCHFSVIDAPGFRSLTPEEAVEVEYYRFDRESFKYVARRVTAISPSRKEKSPPSDAHR